MADKIMEQEEPGPYGYGTGSAVGTLLKRVSGYKIPTQGLLFINLATLVRNTAESGMTVSKVVDNVCNYMTNIATDYAAGMSRWKEFQHHIVYYWTDFLRLVPIQWRRQHKGETALLMEEATATLVKRFSTFKPQESNGTTVRIILGRNVKQPSYKGIVSIANELTKNTTTIQLISHIPVDWHIQRMGRIGMMYRSYTGTASGMTPTELGELAFDMKGIPFYPSTHMVLGDKNCIKSGLVRQAKQEFISKALKDRIVLRSEPYIDSYVKKFMPVQPYSLS